MGMQLAARFAAGGGRQLADRPGRLSSPTRRIENAAYLDRAPRRALPRSRCRERFNDRKLVFHLYIVFAERRDELLWPLQKQRIEAKVHYPMPLVSAGRPAPLRLQEGRFPGDGPAGRHDDLLSRRTSIWPRSSSRYIVQTVERVLWGVRWRSDDIPYVKPPGPGRRPARGSLTASSRRSLAARLVRRNRRRSARRSKACRRVLRRGRGGRAQLRHRCASSLAMLCRRHWPAATRSSRRRTPFVASTAAIVHRRRDAGFRRCAVGPEHRSREDRARRSRREPRPSCRSISPGASVGMDEIMEIANRHGLIVIEDAAQAIGSMYRGRLSRLVRAFRLLLGASAQEPECAGRRRLRHHQRQGRWPSACGGCAPTAWPIGRPSRNGDWSRGWDTLQAAILSYRLDKLPDVIAKRRANARALPGPAATRADLCAAVPQRGVQHLPHLRRAGRPARRAAGLSEGARHQDGDPLSGAPSTCSPPPRARATRRATFLMTERQAERHPHPAGEPVHERGRRRDSGARGHDVSRTLIAVTRSRHCHCVA